MRRPVLVTMSAVSVVVAVASLRSSSLGPTGGSLATAPAGVVAAPAAPSPARSPRANAPAAVAAKVPTAASPTAVRALATSAPPQPKASPAAQPAKAAPRPAAAPKPKPSPAATTTTVNGAPADTQYGPVQVQIQIRSHRIISANAIEYPQGSSRDQQINSYAIPQLNQETLNAQSSNIDTVSGATYTSDGYRQSLQSALDSAHQAGIW